MNPVSEAMTHEPLRLPAWAASIVLLVCATAAAALLGDDWTTTLGTALAALPASLGIIGAAESRRARTDSPATLEAEYGAITYRTPDE